MMRSFLRYWVVALCLIVGSVCSPQAQMTATGVGAGGFGAASFTPSCTESSNFIARTSGLSVANKLRYDTLICGLVTDGLFATRDAFYILAAPDSTTAKLNLISASFGLTEVGSVTFTANVGYNTDGTTGALDTNYDPWNGAGPYQFVQDSASMGICVSTNNAAYDTGAVMGSVGNGTGSNASNLYLMQNSAVAFAAINAGGNFFPTISTQQGNWILSRTASNATELYRNAASVATSANVSAPGTVNAVNMWVMGSRTTLGNSFANTADKFTYAFFGGALNATQVANLTARVATFMTGIGINVCS